MAAKQQNSSKMISAQLRNKANAFLNSRKYANNLADILQMFEVETDNYSSLLLIIEVIFTELLKRGDLIEDIVPLKLVDNSPEAEYTRWLRECYEAALTHTLNCIKKGNPNSRLQAVVTACKLLQAEGKYPLESSTGYYFPVNRLKNIFTALVDSDESMSSAIIRFQEFTEFRDVQQYGLKVLTSFGYHKTPSPEYMQNYFDIMDKLLINEIPIDGGKMKLNEREEDGDKYLCASEGKPPFQFISTLCRRNVNRCWSAACQWALWSHAKPLRSALLLLVTRLMPLLSKPQLTTDMLLDCLDQGGSTSILALQGVLELVRRHNIDYPDIYDRLYSMFEPEMFATRHKTRLIHLADIFLSSTHLPEALVAGFIKRICRLALLASEADAVRLLQLAGNLLRRHPALKRMITTEDNLQPMSSDPYVMEETRAGRSMALQSSLWELPALAQHFHAPTAQAAKQLLHAPAHAALAQIAPGDGDEIFDSELRTRFKTIELNFIRPQGMRLPAGDRLAQYWDLLE